MTKLVLVKARVVKHGFEQQRVGPRNVEIAARTPSHVQMHRHAQPPAFGRDVAEDENPATFCSPRRKSRRRVRGDKRLRRWRGNIVKIERPQIGGFELDCDRAPAFVTLQRRVHYLLQIFAERGGWLAGKGIPSDTAASSCSSSPKNALRSEFFEARLRVLSSGNSKASSKGTHRNRGGARPGPIEMRLASMVSMPELIEHPSRDKLRLIFLWMGCAAK